MPAVNPSWHLVIAHGARGSSHQATPPCCSECITLDKRLLIEGEGQLGEASIDQRANVPTFRVLR